MTGCERDDSEFSVLNTSVGLVLSVQFASDTVALDLFNKFVFGYRTLDV